MRVTAIPAQITTVEDRIVGSFNLSQLLLLCTPVLMGGLLYAAAPQAMTISLYKILVTLLFAVICGMLAIRIKGVLVLHWASILVRYWVRPRYYVFDKHSLHGRKQYKTVPVVDAEEKAEKPKRTRKLSSLSFEEAANIQELIRNPAANVAFETRKGGLYVRITEVKQEV